MAKKAGIKVDLDASQFTRGAKQIVDSIERINKASERMKSGLGMAANAASTTKTKFAMLAQDSAKVGTSLTKVSAPARQTKQSLDAAGVAATKLRKEFGSMGDAAERSGQRVSQAAGKTKTAMSSTTAEINKATGSTSRLNGATVGLAGSMVGLSAGIVGIVQSMKELKQVQVDVEAKEVSITQIRLGLKRAIQDVQIEERELAEARAAGTISAEELADRTRRLAIEYEQIQNDQKDLKVNTEELALIQERASDAYVTMAVSMATTGVSSITSIISMLSLMTAEQKKSAVGALKSAGIIRGSHKTVQVSMAQTAVTSRAAVGGVTSTNVAMTATGPAGSRAAMGLRAAALGFRGLMAAMGPIGWIMIGITAAWAAWESNLFGVQEAVAGLVDWLGELWEGLKVFLPILRVFDPALEAVSEGMASLSAHADTATGSISDLDAEVMSFSRELDTATATVGSAAEAMTALEQAEEAAAGAATLFASDLGDIADELGTGVIPKLEEAADDMTRVGQLADWTGTQLAEAVAEGAEPLADSIEASRTSAEALTGEVKDISVGFQAAAASAGDMLTSMSAGQAAISGISAVLPGGAGYIGGSGGGGGENYARFIDTSTALAGRISDTEEQIKAAEAAGDTRTVTRLKSTLRSLLRDAEALGDGTSALNLDKAVASGTDRDASNDYYDTLDRRDAQKEAQTVRVADRSPAEGAALDALFGDTGNVFAGIERGLLSGDMLAVMDAINASLHGEDRFVHGERVGTNTAAHMGIAIGNAADIAAAGRRADEEYVPEKTFEEWMADWLEGKDARQSSTNPYTYYYDTGYSYGTWGQFKGTKTTGVGVGELRNMYENHYLPMGELDHDRTIRREQEAYDSATELLAMLPGGADFAQVLASAFSAMQTTATAAVTPGFSADKMTYTDAQGNVHDTNYEEVTLFDRTNSAGVQKTVTSDNITFDSGDLAGLQLRAGMGWHSAFDNRAFGDFSEAVSYALANPWDELISHAAPLIDRIRTSEGVAEYEAGQAFTGGSGIDWAGVDTLTELVPILKTLGVDVADGQALTVFGLERLADSMGLLADVEAEAQQETAAIPEDTAASVTETLPPAITEEVVPALTDDLPPAIAAEAAPAIAHDVDMAIRATPLQVQESPAITDAFGQMLNELRNLGVRLGNLEVVLRGSQDRTTTAVRGLGPIISQASAYRRRRAAMDARILEAAST